MGTDTYCSDVLALSFKGGTGRDFGDVRLCFIGILNIKGKLLEYFLASVLFTCK